ncbi:hypothetical protein [Thiohalospira sp.]|uniref:hypothetical protein n=1 Tax=Thiohalospira sp. TaxID=3080549 RepID=UPI00397FCE7E
MADVRLERRRGPDYWRRGLGVVTALGWLALLAALFTLDVASPPREYFLHRAWEHFSGERVVLPSAWDREVLAWVPRLLVLGLVLGATSLLTASFRLRRSRDPSPVGAFLLVPTALVALVLMALYGP